ncbi:MAG: polysaccharide biosynthesis protein [Fidelibacterota bacterium]
MYFIVLADGVAIIFSLLLAYWLRFDFRLPSQYWSNIGTSLLFIIPLKLLIFRAFGLYRGIYRYTSIWDGVKVLKASTTASLVIIVFYSLSLEFEGLNRSIFVIDYLLSSILVGFVRVSVRFYYSAFQNNPISNHKKKTRLILLGAGNTGEKIAREILATYPSDFEIIGFLEDDVHKLGASIHGIPILGSMRELAGISVPYDEILITAPSSTSEQMRQIVELCEKTGKRFRTIPSFSELMNNQVSIKDIREVSILDLLGREEVQLDKESIKNFMGDKRILVTGAGGSIGSELVRQCLQYDPGSLIMIDNSEQNLFSIEQDCNEMKGKTLTKAILANVRDEKQMNVVFKEYRPQIVFHAAAYKHVPMQELHPWAAVNTNVLGTMIMAELSTRYHVDKFVLVSTDKAVSPVNIMGATKRLAEKIVLSVDKISQTKMIAVRFGNVIGSSGSVIPTFQKQIKHRGPITITHPEMYRYFMSVSEASQLIFQAGTMGKKGRILVLDMGTPIRIKDMAYDLIRLSGFEPEKDISIVYTGLRPGEKLYEELVAKEERIQHTAHKKIMVLKDQNNHPEWEYFKKDILSLIKIAETYESDAIKQKLQLLVPDYTPQDYFALGKKLDLDVVSIKGQA